MATIEADGASHTLTFHYSPELDAVVTRLAEKAGKPKNEYLRRLFLDAIEDAEDYVIAEEAYADFVASGEKAIPSDQVRRELGLDD